ncbi:hypothetical protein C8R47DRAFT_1243723 [Mycena vitilis]|nr:hypothetical protein C8R47DRAFT_1243723 [Mycena vitilis]
MPSLHYPLAQGPDATRLNSTQRDAGVSRDVDCSLLNNEQGFGPCTWDPDSACHDQGSAQCICSGVSYLVSAACKACLSPPNNMSWDDYNTEKGCGTLPQQFPSQSDPPPTESNVVPSWALAMISATPTPTIFDLAAASGFVEPPSSSTSVSSSTDANVSFSTEDNSAPTSSGAQQPQESGTGGQPVPFTLIFAIATGVCLLILFVVLGLWIRCGCRQRKRVRDLEIALRAVARVAT